MSNSEKKADWNSTAGKPEPKHSSAHEVDPHRTDAKHDAPLGRVGIAPAKPVWPSKK